MSHGNSQISGTMASNLRSGQQPAMSPSAFRKTDSFKNEGTGRPANLGKNFGMMKNKQAKFGSVPDNQAAPMKMESKKMSSAYKPEL